MDYLPRKQVGCECHIFIIHLEMKAVQVLQKKSFSCDVFYFILYKFICTEHRIYACKHTSIFIDLYIHKPEVIRNVDMMKWLYMIIYIAIPVVQFLYIVMYYFICYILLTIS